MIEFDYTTAVDLLAIPSPTQAQLVQAFNKIEPLDHIGGIVIGSGANNQHPNVTDNPRYKRYIWIDNQDLAAPIIKTYAPTTTGDDAYDSWTNSLLSDGSVTSNKIAQYAVSVLTYLGEQRISYRQDQTPDITKANYILRVDASGQYIEVASAATIVNGVTINLSQLANTGAADGYVVSWDAAAGVAKWAALNINAAIANNSVAYSKLINAAAANYGWLMRANPATGIIELVSNSDKDAANDLLAIRSVRLNRLDATAAVAYDRIRFDGTNWVRNSPFYGAPTSGGTTIPVATAGGQLLAAHGLGAAPRRFGGYIICASADANYSVGDIIQLGSLMFRDTGVSNELSAAAMVCANATNVFANFRNGGAGDSYGLVDNTTGLRVAITETSWNVFLWAEL